MRALAVAGALVPCLAFADLFSPGELAKPHQDLEGLQNCTKCHPAGQQLSQASCLSCHTELNPQIGKGRGFHGRISSDKRNCEQCHHEHQGRGAPLVVWGAGGIKAFNHARTGWALHGAHLNIECKKCHEKRYITLQPALALIEKHGRETFLGLPNACSACHADEHRNQVGQQCEGCHVEKAWKPAPGFDHGQTEYALTGKHAAVSCEKCHPKVRDDSQKSAFPAPKNDWYLKYAPIEHAACTECHKDPHEGRFGPKCGTCHSTQGWMIIRNASQERAFHDKTRFPLKGEHLDAACTSCHGPWPGRPAKFKGLQFDQCSDCHPDGHLGQLSKVPVCDNCHTVEGFLPVRFGLTQHKTTRFPLDGAHATVGCLACHPRSAALESKIPVLVRTDLKKKKRPELFSFAVFDFKVPLDHCDSCHADAHAGQFKDKACTTCHGQQSFSALDFDHDKDSKYPLTGKHAKVECEKCHAPDKKGGPVKYRGLLTACSSCHADVHAGQLAPSRGAVTECDRCHETKGFKPAKFAHEPPFTKFLLEGKHATLACEACHKPVKVAGGVTAVRYKPLPQSCEGCHSDFHQGAFQGFEP